MAGGSHPSVPPTLPEAELRRLQAMFSSALAGVEPGDDLVAIGANLHPLTLIAAYRAGLFPMGVGEDDDPQMGWWSPDPRGVLPLTQLRLTRSLRASCRRFEIRVDSAFDEVVLRCADPSRPGAWITPQIHEAYRTLHQLGVAHSVECWLDGDLVGGLYGVGLGGLFAGESMFHSARDASKVALVALVQILSADVSDEVRERRVLDVQWRTDHLASLGVIDVPRDEYLTRLDPALDDPQPRWAPPTTP